MRGTQSKDLRSLFDAFRPLANARTESMRSDSAVTDEMRPADRCQVNRSARGHRVKNLLPRETLECSGARARDYHVCKAGDDMRAHDLPGEISAGAQRAAAGLLAARSALGHADVPPAATERCCTSSAIRISMPPGCGPGRDGADSVLDTFRSALNRIEETPGFCYSHTSSAHYSGSSAPIPPCLQRSKSASAKGAGKWWAAGRLSPIAISPPQRALFAIASTARSIAGALWASTSGSP